ncbi:hypothetical protein ACOMCU_22625 [Lysinibacillus sp. UGB7]|uniref:hypothetical protein n=1 Tax=Lysinibacillus sp. UGB7 TaxID=3411039 RepID=UPI003B7BB526
MKKLLYLGALSAILLTACEEEKPATEPTEVETGLVTTESTQEELNAKMKSEAIELDIVAVNENKVKADTKVFAKGIVSGLVTEKSVDFEFVLTTEGEETGMYGIENYALTDTKYGAEITVYGTYNGMNNLGIPTITATLVE